MNSPQSYCVEHAKPMLDSAWKITYWGLSVATLFEAALPLAMRVGVYSAQVQT